MRNPLVPRHSYIILIFLINSFSTFHRSSGSIPCHFNKLCSCSNSDNPIREVTCIGLPVNQIPNLPSDVHIYRLNFIGSPELQTLGPNCLGSSLISSVTIKRCKLNSIDSSAFNGTQATLTTLDLSNNELEDFSTASIKDFPLLQWLSLKSNKLTSLSTKDWKNLFSHQASSSQSSESSSELPPNIVESSIRSLLLGDNLLTFIPDLVFSQLINLQSLDLDNNRIGSLDGKPFPSPLTSLSLGNNLLEKFPSESLWNLNRLRWLTLRGNAISNLPNFWPLPVEHIELLDLSHNLINTLQSSFFTSFAKVHPPSRYHQPYHHHHQHHHQHHHPNHHHHDHHHHRALKRGQRLTGNNETFVITIRELLLDFNLIQTLDEDSFNYVSIERLSIANNHLSSLPVNLFANNQLTSKLKVLDISFNPLLAGFPDSLKPLAKLTNLFLRGIKLSHLDDDSFSSSGNDLQIIDLSSNLLTSLPSSSLSKTKKLVKLNLGDNLITSLDSNQLGAWSSKLLSLSLSKNGLQSISSGAFRFTTNLRELRLAYNNLIHVGGKLLGPLSKSLTILELSYSIHSAGNSNGDGPLEAIDTLVKLELLEMDNNQLGSTSSRSLQGLPSLVHIDLEGNQLTSLAANLFNGSRQTKLRNIIISNNRLTVIKGETFEKLGQLVTIDLRGNRLVQLQARSFTNLPMIQTLVLTRNRINLIQPEAIVNCSNLVNLLLQENQLTDIDLSVFRSIWTTKDSLNGNKDDDNQSLLVNHAGLNLNLSRNAIEQVRWEISDEEKDDDDDQSDLPLSPQVSTVVRDFGGNVSLDEVESFINRSGNNQSDLSDILSDGSSVGGLTSDIIGFPANDLPGVSLSDLSSVSPNDPLVEQPSIVSRQRGRINIRSLDLSFNKVSQLSGKVTRAIGSHLLTLNMNHNRLTNFPLDSLVYCPQLMSLSLSNNLISQASQSQRNNSPVSSLSSLSFQPTSLSASSSSSTSSSSSSSSSSCCEKLIFLDLSYNNISNLSSFESLFSTMSTLMTLDLSHNQLNTIHGHHLNGTLVSKLSLNHNHLSSLADFSSNNSSYHHCFGISSTLTSLDLSYNHFHSLPQEINSCQRLVSLCLQGNLLHQLEDNLLANIPFLRELDLSHNSIKQIGEGKPITINLKSLKTLRLRNTSLTRVPRLSSSSNLVHLDLSSNFIQNISSWTFSSTPLIKHLNLSANLLNVVPEELASLRSLIYLYLANNPISNLDSSSFAPFKYLKTIDIRSLSLRYIDLRMFNSLKYLTELRTSTYPRVRSFRLADLLAKSVSLRKAWIQVEESTLSHQIQSAFGPKLKELVITGNHLEKILPDAFLGLHHRPDLTLRIIGTNITSLPAGLLRYISDIRHMTIDLGHNQLTELKPEVLLLNPNKTPSPSILFSSNNVQISGGLLLEENPLVCTCNILWLGSWLRKWLKETRKVHLLNYEAILLAESKARLITCKYSYKQWRNSLRGVTGEKESWSRGKTKLISIPLLDLYPEDIGCNSCSTNLSFAQLLLSTWFVCFYSLMVAQP